MHQKLADYTIVKLIGQGHNSDTSNNPDRIYKAFDRDGKKCAIKLVKHDIHQFDFKIIQNEVEILKHLHSPEPHPYIVRPFDFIELIKFDDIQSQHTSSLIIFELLEEGSLQDFIEDLLIYFKKPSHREAVVRTYFSMLVNALKYCHKQKNIVHRDLKPENILLDELHNIRIIDWEYSTQVKDLSEKNFQIFTGTKRFMSPEIIELEKGDQNHFYAPGPSDIYACGIVLFVMITGVFPYGKASEEDALYRKFIQQNSQFWKDVKKKYKMSNELVRLFNGILELNTDKRFDWEEIETSDWINLPSIAKSYIEEMISEIKQIKTKKLTAIMEESTIDEYLKERCETLLSLELVK